MNYDTIREGQYTSWNDTNRELASKPQAARWKSSPEGTKRSGKRFAEARFSINESTARSIRSHVLNSEAVRQSSRRSNNRSAIEPQRTSTGISSSSFCSTSAFSYSLISAWDSLCRGWTIGSSSSRFLCTLPSSSAALPPLLAPITWLCTCLSRPRDCSSCRARVSAGHSSHSLPRIPAFCQEEEEEGQPRVMLKLQPSSMRYYSNGSPKDVAQ